MCFNSAFKGLNAVELGYNVIEGTEQIVSLYKSVAVSDVNGTSAGKIFQDKIQTCRLIT
jgi:hypothetical protein